MSFISVYISSLTYAVKAIPMYEELYKTAFGPRGTDVSVLAWHVKLIAVRPSRQRQGLGKSLMRVICKEVKILRSVPERRLAKDFTN